MSDRGPSGRYSLEELKQVLAVVGDQYGKHERRSLDGAHDTIQHQNGSLRSQTEVIARQAEQIVALQDRTLRLVERIGELERADLQRQQVVEQAALQQQIVAADREKSEQLIGALNELGSKLLNLLMLHAQIKGFALQNGLPAPEGMPEATKEQAVAFAEYLKGLVVRIVAKLPTETRQALFRDAGPELMSELQRAIGP